METNKARDWMERGEGGRGMWSGGEEVVGDNPLCLYKKISCSDPVLQIRRGNRDNFGIISYIFP